MIANPALTPYVPGSPLVKQAFGSFPSGVVSVCALVEGEPVGMVASSFTTVSWHPPLVSFCIQASSSTWPRLATAPRLGISVLADVHRSVSYQLASRSRDRFAGVGVETTDDGAIFLHDAAAWLDCTVESLVPAGDHDIVVLAVQALSTDPDSAPLVYHRSGLHRLETDRIRFPQHLPRSIG